MDFRICFTKILEKKIAIISSLCVCLFMFMATCKPNLTKKSEKESQEFIFVSMLQGKWNAIEAMGTIYQTANIQLQFHGGN